MNRPTKPSHHRPDGTFANPWGSALPRATPLAMLKWQWQRLLHGRPAAPPADAFARALPQIERPQAAIGECRLTWLGQSSFFIQLGGLNLLTDPVLSRRASPFASFGPARLVPAPLHVQELPRIDAVLISHDHYDHLDERTIASLVETFGAQMLFVTPLAYRDWFAKRAVHDVVERDWWESQRLSEDLEVVCLPSQHWTRRGFDTAKRLWCSWLLRTPTQTVYFCGDSGYCPVFQEIRERVGAPDIALLPIGAYEPRWFMKAAHMNPEEAVQTYLDLGAREFVAMHWGTFRLTDEPMLEPPERVRAAWRAQNLPDQHLHIPRHGETIIWRAE